ncbi:MAG TPA: chromate transporter [Candidatus Caccoplasma merdavium]|nr:chromate transporter [Candidatus Caccoplasma merdavium]
MIWLQLFYSFFKIGLFGFGGGYAMLSMIQGEVVTRHEWLTPQEFTDIIAISQMTPGPIGINSATYIGYTATGSVWGSALATFALVLPSFIVMLILYRFFMRYHDNRHVTDTFAGLRPAVIGLIASAALVLMNTENFGSPTGDTRQFVVSLLIFGAVLAANFFFKVNAILLIVLAGVAGFLIY